MKNETRLFLYLVPFFAISGVVYAFWSHGEPVGSAGMLLVAAVVGMIGAYFSLLTRRIDPRPEDDQHGEIEHGAGDQGVYSPWSWWPLVIAGATTMLFLGLAIGWWLLYVAVAIGIIGLVGWVFEFSRGQHAH
ncbi:cytochrome c oxidase subunit 4 [Pengzhenrongella sp.]|jgi:hypothetical protein|uniref:cytochrome c oxidase subunit 4 n=1 Tax=Pengzhenrongella sp. TaxID=2888820 RepID=UPI002F9216F4